MCHSRLPSLRPRAVCPPVAGLAARSARALPWFECEVIFGKPKPLQLLAAPSASYPEDPEINIRSLIPVGVKSRVPPRATALLDYALLNRSGRVAPAFNGQSRRQELILDLFDRLEPTCIIETGTFRGATTEALSELTDGQVHTIEAFPRFYYFSKWRLGKAKNVHLHLGDSADVLRRLATGSQHLLSRALIYLDAHSSELQGVADVADELPLSRELTVIADNWSESVLLIDDFQVADDPGYGFDHYESGNLDLAYLQRAGMLDRFALFYPAAASSEESGARRGSLIMATRDKAEELVARSGLLRPVPVG